jgi:ASC-1-like (ASCH) protein
MTKENHFRRLLPPEENIENQISLQPILNEKETVEEMLKHARKLYNSFRRIPVI